jgi:hypothetical protein
VALVACKDTVSHQLYYLRSYSLGPGVGLSSDPVRPYVSAEYGRVSFHAGGWLS